MDVGLFAYVISLILESNNLRNLDKINYDLFVYHGTYLSAQEFKEIQKKFRLGKLYFQPKFIVSSQSYRLAYKQIEEEV